MKSATRRGFTLVELLIVIAIIGMLVALLLPAVQAAREAGRRATCINNLNNIGKAAISYGTDKGQLPGLVEFQRSTVSPYVAALDGNTASNNVVDLALPWPALLLSRLEQRGLSDQIMTNNGGVGAPLSPDSVYVAPPLLEFFICPSDEATNNTLARLSYVANSGYFDSSGSGKAGGPYIDDVNANGLFHDQRNPNASKLKYATDIKDGTGTTLMLSENVHKDETINASGDFKVNWLGPVVLRPLDTSNVNVEQIYGFVWDYDSAEPNDPASQERFNQDSVTPPSYSQFNRPRFFARPSSAHPDVFCAVMAGGSTKEVRSDIEYRVYQQLMTPDGAKADALDIANQANGIRSAAEETAMRMFMQPPLKDSDY